MFVIASGCDRSQPANRALEKQKGPDVLSRAPTLSTPHYMYPYQDTAPCHHETQMRTN